MLADSVLITASTRIRSDEAGTLKWRDIRETAPPAGTDQQSDVILLVSGQTGPRKLFSKNGDVTIFLTENAAPVIADNLQHAYATFRHQDGPASAFVHSTWR